MRVDHIEAPGKLYRVGHWLDTKGLWYDANGKPTGLIHTIPGAVAASLPMGHHDVFRSDGGEWISTTDTPEALPIWFSPADMQKLWERGFRVMEFDVKRYRRFHFDEYGYSHEVLTHSDVLGCQFIDPAPIFGAGPWQVNGQVR